MTITINGSGTITGLSAGGLPDGTVTAADIAAGQVFALNGVQFPASQVSSADANTLDDYEEGSWTPALGGTWTSNPTTLSGQYIKIGRVVHVRMTFAGGTKSSATSGYFTGLPFNTQYPGVGSVSDSGVGNNGICLAFNTDRIWLTNTTFGSTNYVSATYITDN